ncbi:MAG: hypothetical protein AAFU73_20485 [Planctomycetota bacterium]
MTRRAALPALLLGALLSGTALVAVGLHERGGERAGQPAAGTAPDAIASATAGARTTLGSVRVESAAAGRSQLPDGTGRLWIHVTADGAPAADVPLGVVGPETHWPSTDEQGNVALEVEVGEYDVFVVRGHGTYAPRLGPNGDCEEIQVQVTEDAPGAPAPLEALVCASFTLRWNESMTWAGPTFQLVDTSEWIVADATDRRSTKTSVTWTGLDPGRYRVTRSPFAAARGLNVELGSGEERVEDVDADAVLLSVHALLSDHQDRRVPVDAWVNIEQLEEETGEWICVDAITALDGEARARRWLPRGRYRVGVDDALSLRAGTVQVGLPLLRTPPVEVMLDAAEEVEYVAKLDVPLGTRLVEGRIQNPDRLPRRSFRGPTVWIQVVGVAGAWVRLGKEESFRIRLDAARADGATVEVWSDHPDRGVLLGSRIAGAGGGPWDLHVPD